MEIMHLVMLLNSFVMVVTLFASAIAILAWIGRRFVRDALGLFSSAEKSRKQRMLQVRDPLDTRHPDHWKRAGQ
jgi:hypothetical protein